MVYIHQINEGNPIAISDWNKEKILNFYLAGYPKDDPQREEKAEKDMNQNIINRIENLSGPAFDPNSIMTYGIPACWTKNKYKMNFNYKFSEMDKQGLRAMYPDFLMQNSINTQTPSIKNNRIFGYIKNIFILILFLCLVLIII